MVERQLPKLKVAGSRPVARLDSAVLSSRTSGVEKEDSIAGVAQLAERQPSKLKVAGSTPVARFHRKGRTRKDFGLLLFLLLDTGTPSGNNPR